MKIRTNFVSNSSSSSFICDVCGEKVEGFDLSLCNAEMYRCIYGHTFCVSEAITNVADDYMDDGGYGIPSLYCPICNFKEVSHRDIAVYLERTNNISREAIFAEVKAINKRRKVLRDQEYVELVCMKIGTDTQKILLELKEKFQDYTEFIRSIK